MNATHPTNLPGGRIRRTRLRIALAVGTMLVALPGAAQAAPATASLPAQVAQYTTAADTALDRATSHFAAGRGGPAVSSLAQARGATVKATRAAQALQRRASTPTQRVAAARAIATLGEHHDAAVEAALAMVGPAPAGAEGRVIATLKASVVGRERAVQSVLGMVPALPQRAQVALGRAAAGLVAGRADEATATAEALAGGELSSAAASRMVGIIDTSLRGQQRSTARLEMLRGRLSQRAGAGLDRAIASIGADRSRAGAALEGALASAPPAVRERVEGILGRVRPAGDDGVTPGTAGPAGPPATPTAGAPAPSDRPDVPVDVPAVPVETPAMPVEVPTVPAPPAVPVEAPSIPVPPIPGG